MEILRSLLNGFKVPAHGAGFADRRIPGSGAGIDLRGVCAALHGKTDRSVPQLKQSFAPVIIGVSLVTACGEPIGSTDSVHGHRR
jgi:hypothetical protein